MHAPHKAVRQQQRQQVSLITVLLAEPRLEFGLDKQQLRTACGRLSGVSARFTMM
jgi:hypothetical protein